MRLDVSISLLIIAVAVGLFVWIKNNQDKGTKRASKTKESKPAKPGQK